MVGAAGHREWAWSASLRTIWTFAGAVALGVFAILVVGGYAFGWKWTGLSGSVTLWDWLEVLALPVAIATAPLLLHHRRGLTRRHRVAIATGLTVFAAPGTRRLRGPAAMDRVPRQHAVGLAAAGPVAARCGDHVLVVG